MRVGLAQIRPRLGRMDENVKLHLDQIRQAKEEQVDLLVFPELSLTGYYLLDLTYDVACQVTSEVIQTVVQHAEGIDLIFGFVESSPEHVLFNSAIYAHNKQIQTIHRKVYLPTYGMFDESRYFNAGDQFRSFPTPLGKMGMLICEDLWHPSSSYIMALDGANMITVLANSPFRGMHEKGFTSFDHWRKLLAYHAKTYGAYLLFAHRVGTEDGITFFGGSSVINPFGELVGEARLFEEELFIVDIDLDQVRQARYELPILGSENLDLTIRELKRIQQQRLRRDIHD